MNNVELVSEQPHLRAVGALSQRQRRVLAFIESYVADYGFPPSLREIGDECGMSSTSTVAYNLRRLNESGHLERHPGKPRCFRVVKHPA